MKSEFYEWNENDNVYSFNISSRAIVCESVVLSQFGILFIPAWMVTLSYYWIRHANRFTNRKTAKKK